MYTQAYASGQPYTPIPEKPAVTHMQPEVSHAVVMHARTVADAVCTQEEPALAVPLDSFVSPQTGKVRKKMKKKKKKNVAEGEEEALALEDAAPTPSPRKKKKKKKKVVEEEEEEEELDPNDGGKE